MVPSPRRFAKAFVPGMIFFSLMGLVPADARVDASHAVSWQSLNVPLPPPRPADITPPSHLPEPKPAAPVPGPEDQSCARVLASDKLVVSSIAPILGADGCGIASPVKLTAIVLHDGTHIPLDPAATLRCALAEALGDWVRDDVAPLAAQSGSGLSQILGSEGYECRSRNRVVGAKLSEHATGNAYDLVGFVLRDGRRLTIAHPPEAQDVMVQNFMAQLKTASCARFMTVLGPGSDTFHETHLHVDLAERHGNYRICQWDVK